MDEQNRADLVEMEIEENTQRKDLTSDELAEAYLRLDKLRNPGFLVRIWRAIAGFFSRVWRAIFGAGSGRR